MDENENVFTGKTVDEAVTAGLEALGITLADAEIEVLEEGKKKLFGSVKAKVRITVKQSDDTPLNPVFEEEEDEMPVFTAAASAAEPEEEEEEEDGEDSEAPEEEETEDTEDTESAADGTSAEDTTEADAARAAEFINGLLPLLHIEGAAEVLPENEDGSISINVSTPTTYKVIGKRGDVLDSIQCIAGAIANIGRSRYKKVVVDCENYRATRKDSLEHLAHKLEKKAIETGRKIILEPMNPYERRIIHSALTDSPDVTTMSEGKEPNRYVVVIPSNAKPYDKGIRYSSQHNNGPQRGGHGAPQRGGRGGSRPANGGSRGNFNRDKQSGPRPYDRDRQQGGRPYDRDRQGQGGGRPYDRDRQGQGGGRPYDRDRQGQGGGRPYDRDSQQGGGRPYDRDRQNGGRSYDRDNGERSSRGPRDNRDRDSRDSRDRGSRPASGGSRSKRTPYFGTYLGNVNDNKKDE